VGSDDARPIFLPPHSDCLFPVVHGGVDRWSDVVAPANDPGLLDDARYDTLSRGFGIDWLE